jgi:hypothetical protein
MAVLSVYRDGHSVFSITEHGGDCCFGIDPTDRSQMAKALMYGREYALGMARFFRKYVPGFERSYLLQIAPMLGVRESRRIVGDYTLTEDDARDCRSFEDAIGLNGCRLDVHRIDSDSPGLAGDIGPRGYYQIPYRILLPKGVEGLVTAGRCVSSDHVAHASMRHQGSGCMVTGHASGTAAALAALRGTTPRALGVGELQEVLRSQGAIISLPEAGDAA